MTENEFKQYLKKQFPHKSSFWSGFSIFCVDCFSTMFCFCLSFFIINLINPPAIHFKVFINYAIFFPFIWLLFACIGLYPGIMISPTEEIRKIFLSFFFCFSGITVFLLFSELWGGTFAHTLLVRSSNLWALAVALLLNVPITTLFVPVFREGARHYFSRFRWWGVASVLYCNGEIPEVLIDRIKKNPYLGYKIAVIVDQSRTTDCFEPGKIPVLCPNSKLLDELHKSGIKVAFLSDCGPVAHKFMQQYRYTITVMNDQANFTNYMQMRDIAGILGYSSTQQLSFKANLILKRIIDIGIILFFSPFILPVFLVLMFLTKVTSKGPIFYGHKRVGKNGKEFKCWKFRSMGIDSAERLEEILATDPVRRAEWEKDRKFSDDPRVTKFGRILRKTSLDELPQLINVLTGEMSLVGPRPVTEPELVKYGEYKDYVLSVTPGLSGMWQVSGRSDTAYEERVSLDTFYINNWSIWMDIWILIKTVWVVLNHKGAY
ncbi:MAG: undecaprenyl-phosphate galactose phosphotransferase WbaP [Treponemataceae bacterium]|nr:undecaprenyl-phosphate galactose phosphotransferase WbaP [Treponemataceae bacterium]